jgi:hypothetical protein
MEKNSMQPNPIIITDKHDLYGSQSENQSRADRINAFWSARGINAGARIIPKSDWVRTSDGLKLFHFWSITSDLTGGEFCETIDIPDRKARHGKMD